MPDWVAELVRYGPLGLFAAAVCFGIWKFLVFTGHQLFDEEKGIVRIWVAGEQRWRTTLTERLETQGDMFGEQQLLCAKHAELLSDIGTSLKLTADATHVGNGHLERLVTLHESSGMIGDAARQIGTNTDDLQSLKQAAIHACDLCEAIAKQELPNSAPAVTMHCARIRDIIGKQP